MCASRKCCWKMECNINNGLHVSVVACVHQLGDICINQYQPVSANGYVLWSGVNGKQQHPRPACLSLGVFKTTRRHKRLPTIGNFSQGQCALGKRHQPITIDIFQMILVVDFRISHGMCTLLRRHRVWIGYRIRGPCTSLSIRRSWPSRITLGLHTMASRCWM